MRASAGHHGAIVAPEGSLARLEQACRQAEGGGMGRAGLPRLGVLAADRREAQP
ncbi:MAG TPA: hypothetical protein VKV28_03840 [Candidatus Binataceae bacterium]|nr:hypothetical protein [Candidatus Binataceae bacterium]